MTLAIRRTVFLLAMSAALLPMVGCPFFVCQKASCPTTGTTTGTGDYVYVSNSTSGSTYINGYQIGTGSLTAITGSPFGLNEVPVAMNVSPNDDFLYVAGQSSAGLFVYPITSSTGALSSGSQLLQNTEIDAMTISPDGYFLFTLGQNPLTGVEVLTEYSLNSSTGVIAGTGGTSFSLPTGTTCVVPSAATTATQVCSIAVSPDNTYVGASLGTAGTVVFPYQSASSGGITSQSYGLVTPASAVGHYSLAFDTSGYMYVATTNGVTSYSSLSSATPTTGPSYTGFSSGLPVRAVTLSTNSSYLYTADQGNNEISAFNLSGGVLTQQTPNSPQIGPADISALGVDRSGAYLLAGGYNATNGFQMFAISSSGLSVVASQPTGTTTTVPIVMALTH
jgi:6-phosphogluconolactonase (cycloisomerase 2 family)